MPARLHCPGPLREGQVLALPAGPARHVQVLRLQPGDEVTLFDGSGGQWIAHIVKMGRSDVEVRVQRHEAVEREPARDERSGWNCAPKKLRTCTRAENSAP